MLSTIPQINLPTPKLINFKGVEKTKIDLGKDLIPEGDSIIYFSDFHSNISKFPKLVGLIDYIQKQLPGENIIKICSGDFLLGHISKNICKIAKIFNHINLNFITLGNHEFDSKQIVLKTFLEKITAIPIVTNMKDKNHGLPIKESMTITYNKDKMGIVGATVDLTSKKKNYGQMNFEETVKAVQDKVDQLTRSGIKKIMLISHLGIKKDKLLAKQTKDIDIVISAHSHYSINGIKEGLNLERSLSNEPVAIFQAAQNNNEIGYARVKYNNKGVLTKIFNKTIPTNLPFIEEDKEIRNLVTGNKPLKTIARCLYNYNMDRINFSENAFANWITDSMNSTLQKAHIVLLPSRMIRACLQKGNITEREVKEILPTIGSREKEAYQIIKLSGKQLINTIENINIIDNKLATTRIVHASGLKYRIDNDLKLQDVYFKDQNGNYTPVKDNQYYNVAIPGYVLNTGKFKHLELNNAPVVEAPNKTANEILLNSLKDKINIINTKLDGRIKLDFKIEPEFDFNNLPEFVDLEK